MNKSKDIVNGLEMCLEGLCYICPYYKVEVCEDTLKLDALNYIREKEPHLMTLEEVKQSDFLWIEYDSVLARAINMFENDEYIDFQIEDRVYTVPYKFRDYNKKWRCWNANVSEKVRKDAKWDD